MLQHKSGREFHPAHDRNLAPETVYLTRMLAWSAVVVAALVGIELIINDYIVIGALLTVLAAASGFMLRSHGLVRFLSSNRPPPRAHAGEP